jgi:hypothetical protein
MDQRRCSCTRNTVRTSGAESRATAIVDDLVNVGAGQPALN